MGQYFSITYTLRLVERLVIVPNITIMKMGDTSDMIDDDMILTMSNYTTTFDDTGSIINTTIQFNPVRFEDRGIYVYDVEYNVTGVNGTNDPATATYDFDEIMDRSYTLTVDCE